MILDSTVANSKQFATHQQQQQHQLRGARDAWVLFIRAGVASCVFLGLNCSRARRSTVFAAGDRHTQQRAGTFDVKLQTAVLHFSRTEQLLLAVFYFPSILGFRVLRTYGRLAFSLLQR